MTKSDTANRCAPARSGRRSGTASARATSTRHGPRHGRGQSIEAVSADCRELLVVPAVANAVLTEPPARPISEQHLVDGTAHG